MMKKRNAARAILLIAVLALAMVLSGCMGKSDKTVSIGGHDVPTMYGILNKEKKVTGNAAEKKNGVTSKTITYGDGDVDQGDVNDYFTGLVNDHDYLMIDGTQDSNDTSTEIQAAAATDLGDGNIIIVSVDWTESETTVTYQYGEGTVTPNSTSSGTSQS